MLSDFNMRNSMHLMHFTEELLAPHASKIQPSLGWDTASILTAHSQIAQLSDRKLKKKERVKSAPVKS